MDFFEKTAWLGAAIGAAKALGVKALAKAAPMMNKAVAWYQRQPKWMQFVAKTAVNSAMYAPFSLPVTLANQAIETGVTKAFEAGMGIKQKMNQLNQLAQQPAPNQLGLNVKQASLLKEAQLNPNMTGADWAKWFKGQALSTMKGAALWSLPFVGLSIWGAYSKVKNLSNTLDKKIQNLQSGQMGAPSTLDQPGVKTASLEETRYKFWNRLLEKLAQNEAAQAAQNVAQQAAAGGGFLQKAKAFGKGLGNIGASMLISSAVGQVTQPFTAPIEKLNKKFWQKVFGTVPDEIYQYVG